MTGLFYFELIVPFAYPFKPPRVRMLTRCYHSRVTKQGWDPGSLDITKGDWPTVRVSLLWTRI
jgi:ubiquitin-protein ligase